MEADLEAIDVDVYILAVLHDGASLHNMLAIPSGSKTLVIDKEHDRTQRTSYRHDALCRGVIFASSCATRSCASSRSYRVWRFSQNCALIPK